MNKKVIEIPVRLDEKEAAKVLGCSVSGLRKNRMYDRGVPYYKYANGHVRYDLKDIEAYLNGVKVTPKNSSQN